MFVNTVLQPRNSMLGLKSEQPKFQFPLDSRLYPGVCLYGTAGLRAADLAEPVLTAQPTLVDHKLITDEAEYQGY